MERPEVENFDDPGEGTRGAVCEEHDLQAARHEGAVEDVLLQQRLERAHGTSTA